MGRGRQKAKHTKIARDLKYFSPDTNYNALEAEIWELAGEEFNINSPIQLGEILFEKLDPAELPVVYKYDCHNYVNKEAMNALDIELPGTALNQVRLRSYSEKTENKN